jgi:hypothetical protein
LILSWAINVVPTLLVRFKSIRYGILTTILFLATATSSITVVTGTAAVLAASATASTSASAHVEAHGLFVGAMAIFSLMMSLF